MSLGNNYLFAIGIDKYQSPLIEDLNNPVDDVKTIVTVLTERYGFELFMEPLFNSQATRANIYAGFTSLVNGLDEVDNLVIYYSGHGRMHPLTSKGYWVPYDANDTPLDFIENSVIKDFIEAIRAKHIFLIADSCFSGTFLSTTRGSKQGIKYSDLDNQVSRWMLASGGEETVSDGVKGKHSPFARNLLEILNLNTNKFLSEEEIIKYVSALTAIETKQKPRGAIIENVGHKGGQLIFMLNEEFITSYFEESKGVPHTDALLKKYRSVYKPNFIFSAGKEVLIIESFVEGVDLLFVELFRFDDDGKKRIRFHNDCAILTDNKKEIIEWKVVQRFSTITGLEKFIKENDKFFKDKKIVALNANSEIDTVEENEAVVLHNEMLHDIYSQTKEIRKCLHCGERIDDNENYIVELDEDEMNVNVGNVHRTCLRPLDRILGRRFYKDHEESNLLNFDSENWHRLLQRGQDFLRTPKYSSRENNTPVLIWNRKHNSNTGEYCIRMHIEDGSFSYVNIGRSIHRFPSNEIDSELVFFNSHVSSDKGEDAYAYTSGRRMFGTVSELNKIKTPEESILRIIHCEKVRYSNQFTFIKDVDNDYTPLGVVIDANTQAIINFGNCIPIISQPNKFDSFHLNWNKSGYTIGKCSLRVIESDKDLDTYLISFFQDGMQPIIDPLFDDNKELISGQFIQDIDDILEEKQKQTYQLIPDPKWKAGDKVKVILPQARKDIFPIGTIVTDEFLDDKGEKRVMFCPIVDGVQRQYLTVTIPSRLIHEI